MTVTLFCRGCNFQVGERAKFDISPCRSSKQTTRHDADRANAAENSALLAREKESEEVERGRKTVEIVLYGQQNIRR